MSIYYDMTEFYDKHPSEAGSKVDGASVSSAGFESRTA